MRKTQTQLVDKMISVIWRKVACLTDFWRRIKSIYQGNNVRNYENTDKMCLHRRTEVAQHNLVILLREYCWSVCIRSDFNNCWGSFFIRSVIIFYIFMCIGIPLSKTFLKYGVLFTSRSWAVPKMLSVDSSRAIEKKN